MVGEIFKVGIFEQRPERRWEPQTEGHFRQTAQVETECQTGVVRTSEEGAVV